MNRLEEEIRAAEKEHKACQKEVTFRQPTAKITFLYIKI